MPAHSALYVAGGIEQLVPDLLRQTPQWITWVAGPIKPDGKFDKFPKGRDGTGTAWQTSNQWMAFDDALKTANVRGHSGIGLVLPMRTADDMHVVALDFDNVDLEDTDNARLQEIWQIHEAIHAPYVETSPSGKGLRMFVVSREPIEQISAANPLGGRDELFCSSPKWVTVTGKSMGGNGVPDATQELAALCRGWQDRAAVKLPSPHRHARPVALSHLVGGWQGWPEDKVRDGEGRELLMLSYAGHLRATGLAQDEIDRLCLQANEERYADPLDEDVVLDRARRYQDQTVQTVSQTTDAVLEQVDQTDAGNVARLWETSQGDIRYVYEAGVWICWNGKRWEYDRCRSMLHRRTLRVAATYEQKARLLEQQINDPTLSVAQRSSLNSALKSLRKWIVQCRNRKGLDAMITLAQKDPRFVISAAELDKDPTLFGVQNGVVCLKSGVIRPESKADLILRRSPIEFNPNASVETVIKFMSEITSCPDGLEGGKIKAKNRLTLMRHLQKICGYCLTGHTTEQVMFMFSGSGANGKSALVEMLDYVMGDYSAIMQPEILLSTKTGANAEQASPSTRKLAGARCAITSESKEGAQMDVAVVKRHTGDGKMTARGLFEQPITFDITHKLILLTNHPPRVDHMDDAIKGRLQVIPFDMRWNRPGTTEPNPTLPDADKTLPMKLKAEAEGFLRYIVEGSVLYFSEGIAPPIEVTSQTQGYITSQDTVHRWVTTDCTPCPDDEGTTAAQLHLAYRSFCIAEGEQEQAATPAALGRRLKQLGYSPQRTRDGARYPLRPKDASLQESFSALEGGDRH